ncbi:MAG: hypothetical protein RBS24_02560 [Bacilli bacterium]|nr:hypothetical protein [Bacilli bacterium]
MKLGKFKALSLALILPTLTGCAFVDNIIADIALNVVFKTDYTINRITTDGGEAEVKQYDPKPTSADKRGEVTYGVEGLVLPKSIETVQYGFKITIDFTISFSEGAEELFYRQEYKPEESGAEFDFSAEILYPTGSVSQPTDMGNMGEYLTVGRLIEFKNQTAKDIEITLTGKAASKTKSQKYYLNVNSKLVNVPGGEDETIDTEHALILEKVDTPKSLDVRLTPEELILGKTIPLQVMWMDSSKIEGEATATISIVSTIDSKYDVTYPEGWPTTTLTVNKTITEFPVTIRLKLAETPPDENLVVTFKGVLSI